ncbi:hypothetical protein H4R34_002456 [Dimargaris verticillata]|uniref:Ribonuclease H2 subunit B n=1 Tax=Dimargaris verticillata TaxID=2761393 RepID=A0A9W8B2Q4_9FUNG|nr:hypothetical protein H4R34_002456 [Dimargaris verticillata]
MAHNAPPYVCILPQDSNPAHRSNTEYQTLTLPHPVTGQPQLYYWNQTVLCELKLVDFDHERSWFAGNSVVSDGSMHLLTPVDCLFVLLPILQANNQKRDGFNGVYMLLDDLLECDSFPDIYSLRTWPCLATQLELICDTKRITDSEMVYRLNESRALTWLCRKVDQTIDKLANAPELQSVSQNIFFLHNEHSPNATDEKRRVIVDMMGEYLNNEWLERLLASYGGFDQLEHIDRAGRTNSLALDSPEDYMTSRPHPASETPDSPAKKPKLTMAARSLAKANTKGMKSMMSYFSKK